MLLLTASAGGEVVGKVWVCLERRDAGGAWIYDVEVDPPQRGNGYGRALMQVAEEETARRGTGVVGLNVSGANAAARSLYESLGYETMSLQMCKKLTGDPR